MLVNGRLTNWLKSPSCIAPMVKRTYRWWWNMTHWEIINEQVQRTKIRRINYKAIFGKTLTAYITDLRLQGLNSTQTEYVIVEHLKRLHCNTPELVRRIQISISARYGEQESAAKRYEL